MTDEIDLFIFEGKILRPIYDLMKEGEIWRRRRNLLEYTLYIYTNDRNTNNNNYNNDWKDKLDWARYANGGRRNS